MKLYHGSNIAIERIDFARCKPYKDFGQGFYLTEIEEQAIQMARRTAAIYGGEPVVSAFEFDEAAAVADEMLAMKRLPNPTRNGRCSSWRTAVAKAGSQFICTTS